MGPSDRQKPCRHLARFRTNRASALPRSTPSSPPPRTREDRPQRRGSGAGGGQLRGMAGAGRVRRSRRLREAPHRRAAAAAGVAPEDWRDWAGGLPMHVLVKIAKKYIAQADSTWAAQMKTFTQSDSKRDKTGNMQAALSPGHA